MESFPSPPEDMAVSSEDVDYATVGPLTGWDVAVTSSYCVRFGAAGGEC